MADWGADLAPSGDWDLPSDGWGAPTNDGWGATNGAVATTDSWGAVDPTLAAAVAEKKAVAAAEKGPESPPRPRPPPRITKDDDEAVAKQVEKKTVEVCAGKEKLAGLRAKMDELDAKRSALQAEIDVIMPALQDARAQKAVAMGQLSEARLPPIWVERARELKDRSKALPGGCKTQLELQRAIKEAEYNIDHGSLSLKQEKLAMERIRELKKGKELVAAFEADQALLDKVREEHKAVQAELKPVTGNIDELRALATEKANIMDGLMASKSEVRTLRDEASQAFAELKSRLDESFAKVREQQSDAPKAVAAFFAAVQEVDAKLKREKNGEPPPPPPPPEPTAAEKKAAAKAKAEAEAEAKAAAEEAEAKAAAEAKEAAAKEKAEKKAAEKAKVAAEKAAAEKKAAEEARYPKAPPEVGRRWRRPVCLG